MLQEIKENTKKQKILLICEKLLRNIMVIFSSIFLNVYIFNSLDNNINLYLCALICSIVFAEIISVVVLHIINKHNAMIIYRLSFVFDTLLIVLCLVIKNPTFPVVLVFYFLQELGNSCFGCPHEIGEMKATNTKDSKKFMANSSIVSNLTKIASPFLSGLIIDKLSYTWLFVIVGIVTITMFVVSIFMRDFDANDGKLKLKEFCQKARKYPHVKNFYYCYGFFRLSMGGTIYTILPVVLFLKVGSEFSLGSYSSIFALLTIITLLCFMKSKNYKLEIILSLVMISISCFLITFWSSFISFIIFSVIHYMFERLYENNLYSTRLNTIKVPELENYKREHHLMYDLSANIGYLVGYGLILLFYNLVPSANILMILIGAVGLLFNVSGIFLIKSKTQHINVLKQLEKCKTVEEKSTKSTS